MKKAFFLLILLLSSTLHSQLLLEANTLFENVQYEEASKIFESVSQKKHLQLDDYKRLSYCYFVTGSYDKCSPLADSLIKIPEIDPFFYYAHGITKMYAGKYQTAKTSLEKYQVLEKDIPVDVLIISCDSLMVWKDLEPRFFINAQFNNLGANFSSSLYKNKCFVLSESGLDSLGTESNEENIISSEVRFAKPFLVDQTGVIEKINLPEELKQSSITSLAYLRNSNQLLMTISFPLSDQQDMRNQHLYIGNFDTVSLSITETKPWIYSGFDDSTSCTHATVNESGTVVVFSKLGKSSTYADLFISTLTNGEWSKPRSLDEINSKYNDVFPVFSGDTLLSFASDGKPGYGSLDIFTVKVTTNSFGPIQHLNAPINSFYDDFGFVHLNDTLTVCSSNRKGGKGDDDVYLLSLNKPKAPSEQDLYAKEFDEFVKNWKDQHYYFDFSKFDLKSNDSIKALAQALLKFGGCKVKIEGYTDPRGSDEYNQHLGYYRGDAIRRELMSLGVLENRIIVVSKGETNAKSKDNGQTSDKFARNRVAIVELEVSSDEMR